MADGHRVQRNGFCNKPLVSCYGSLFNSWKTVCLNIHSGLCCKSSLQSKTIFSQGLSIFCQLIIFCFSQYSEKNYGFIAFVFRNMHPSQWWEKINGVGAGIQVWTGFGQYMTLVSAGCRGNLCFTTKEYRSRGQLSFQGIGIGSLLWLSGE